MRTRAWTVLGAVILVTVIGVGYFAMGPQVSGEDPAIPSDIAKELGISGTPSDEMVVSRETATEVALAAIGDAAKTATITAYKAKVTDPKSLRTAVALDGRAVWLIVFDGLHVVWPAPAAETVDESQDHVTTRAFVFVDGSTGEHLLTMWRA